MEVGNKLNLQRSYRKGFALKGLRQHIIKTNNPSTIRPGELLTVRFPDLKENQVTIPSTTKLTFNITLAGTDVNRTLVKNLGRNIIKKLIVKLDGNEIISIDDYDILYSFYDCWKTATERRNAIFKGIVEADGQTENAIKHWINATDKANNAKDQTVASIYDNRFCIPLDFEILETSLLLYQYILGSHLTYELTFADYSNVIKATDPDATYTISNISLEFDTIINASLASQIRTEYIKMSIVYDRILRAPIIPLDKSDTSFSIDTSIAHQKVLTLNRPGGGGIRPQAGSSLCCAETVSSRKLKLSDFYYILIGLNSEYKPVPWDIHCCHGNAIVEWCSVKFWLKSVENCIFLLKSFSNLSLGLLFVISISKLPPVPNFKQIGLKAKKLGFSTFF